MKLKLLRICVLLCLLFDYRTNGAYIYFYHDRYMNDQYYHSSIHSGCNHTPDTENFIHGVVTDTCVILYKDQSGLNCEVTEDKWSQFTKRIPAGHSIIFLANLTGYRKCNEDIEELQLNIDIVLPEYYSHSTGMVPYHKSKPRPYKPEWIPYKPEFQVFKTYRDVCTCVNTYKGMEHIAQWAIRNHGNEYVAYFERGCTEIQLEAKLVSERQTWFLNRTFIEKDEALYTPHPIKSIGPSLNSTYFKHSCNMKLKVLDLQNKTNRLEQKLLQSAIFFNESQINMIAKQQKQNLEIRKLEEKYNETEAKLESFQNSLVDKLTELRNELDDSFGHFRDD